MECYKDLQRLILSGIIIPHTNPNWVDIDNVMINFHFILYSNQISFVLCKRGCPRSLYVVDTAYLYNNLSFSPNWWNAQCPCNLYYKCSYWKNNWYQYNEFIKLSKVITITSMYNVTTRNISHVDETWKGLREGILHFVTKNSILKNISRKWLNVLNMGRKIWYNFWCHIN